MSRNHRIRYQNYELRKRFSRFKEAMMMTKKNNDGLCSVLSDKEREVFPGVFHRRHFLRGSLVSAAIALLANPIPRNLLAQEAPKSQTVVTSKLAWDDFLKQTIPV